MRRNTRWSRTVVVVTTLLILVLVNWAIWQKEHHLAEGEIIYLELAPVDPRSLMQGDYMALNFALGNRIQQALGQRAFAEERTEARDGGVIVRLDDQQIAYFQRLDDGHSTLADDERRLRYRLRHGSVQFATNAFFFQEGHAERYESARYGEFRLNDRGELLLVALYDEALHRLGEMVR